MLYEQILIKKEQLEKQIDNIHSQLKTLPEGKLVCCHTNNHYKWYNYSSNGRIYIPKKQQDLAEKLALKKYLILLLKEISHEKRAIDLYLKHHETETPASEKLLQNHPEYQTLLFPYFKPFSQTISEWLNAPYEKNMQYPEKLIHKSISGNVVRSKSEALIDTLLYTNKIPFRYECALYLDETLLFPDFTIIHPHTEQIYYWEHFGMMDKPSYIQKTFRKLQTYANYGIIPSIQLITTYETKNVPLTANTIEKIIQDIFISK